MANIKVGTFSDGEACAGLCTCGFKTTGWPTEEIAADRISQHKAEHDGKGGMEPLSEFRDRHGLIAQGNLAVLPEGVNELTFDEDE